MAKLAKNIVDFCTAVEPYAYVMAVVGCLVLGLHHPTAQRFL